MPSIAVDWYASLKGLPADKAEQPLKLGLILRRHEDLQRTPRAPLDLFLVIDSSASMDTATKDGQTRLQRVSQTAAALVERLADGDGVALLCFGEQAHLVQPLARLGAGAGKPDLVRAVRNILSFPHPRGGTNAPAAVELLRRQLEKDRPAGRFAKALLLSDGENNRGDLARAEADAARVSALGGSVDAWGFGNDDENTLGPLLRIAAGGGGQAFPVPESGTDLHRKMERLLAGAQDVVVTNVQLEVRFADRVYPNHAFCHSPQRLYLGRVSEGQARTGYRLTLSHLEKNPARQYLYVFDAKAGPFAASAGKVRVAEAHLRCDIPSAGIQGKTASWKLELPVVPAGEPPVQDYDMIEVWRQVELTRLAFDYEARKRAKGDGFKNDPELIQACDEIIKKARKWSDPEMQARFEEELTKVRQGQRNPAAFNALLEVSTRTARVPTSMLKHLDDSMFLI